MEDTFYSHQTPALQKVSKECRILSKLSSQEDTRRLECHTGTQSGNWLTNSRLRWTTRVYARGLQFKETLQERPSTSQSPIGTQTTRDSMFCLNRLLEFKKIQEEVLKLF
jgi:hypothetical protein